jgi:hypothetical protein
LAVSASKPHSPEEPARNNRYGAIQARAIEDKNSKSKPIDIRIVSTARAEGTAGDLPV